MSALLTYTLRQGDRALVLAQRLLEVVTHAPEIEEDMALSNLALDLIGQARVLYTHAGEIEGVGNNIKGFSFKDTSLPRTTVISSNVPSTLSCVPKILPQLGFVPYFKAKTFR